MPGVCAIWVKHVVLTSGCAPHARARADIIPHARMHAHRIPKQVFREDYLTEGGPASAPSSDAAATASNSRPEADGTGTQGQPPPSRPETAAYLEVTDNEDAYLRVGGSPDSSTVGSSRPGSTEPGEAGNEVRNPLVLAPSHPFHHVPVR